MRGFDVERWRCGGLRRTLVGCVTRNSKSRYQPQCFVCAGVLTLTSPGDIGPVRDRVGLDRRLGGGDDGASADELDLLAGADPFEELIAADRGLARELCLRHFEGEASLCAQKSLKWAQGGDRLLPTQVAPQAKAPVFGGAPESARVHA